MINKVILIGRLTKDPELRILPSGNKAIDISIAYNRSYRVNNEWKLKIGGLLKMVKICLK